MVPLCPASPPKRLLQRGISLSPRTWLLVACWCGWIPWAAQANPVRCTTTIEAPVLTPGQPLPPGRGPREVTRCGVVGSVSDLVEQRYFTYRTPFSRGVDLLSQITDIFGVARGGRDTPRLMGFGFPDQAVIWDGSAIENTTTFLMDQQVHLVPRRTADLANPYTSSLRGGGSSAGDRDGTMEAIDGWAPR